MNNYHKIQVDGGFLWGGRVYLDCLLSLDIVGEPAPTNNANLKILCEFRVDLGDLCGAGGFI